MRPNLKYWILDTGIYPRILALQVSADNFNFVRNILSKRYLAERHFLTKTSICFHIYSFLNYKW